MEINSDFPSEGSHAYDSNYARGIQCLYKKWVWPTLSPSSVRDPYSENQDQPYRELKLTGCCCPQLCGHVSAGSFRKPKELVVSSQNPGQENSELLTNAEVDWKRIWAGFTGIFIVLAVGHMVVAHETLDFLGGSTKHSGFGTVCVLLLLLICDLVSVAVGAAQLKEFQIKITHSGIWMPRLFRNDSFIGWAEITAISPRLSGGHRLVGDNESVKISIECYKNKSELVAVIRDRVGPKVALPATWSDPN